MALWAISGAATAYQVQVITEYVQVVPVAIRAQAIGLASAALLGAQGVGLLIGGTVEQFTDPTTAVALAGGAASVLATLLAMVRLRLPTSELT